MRYQNEGHFVEAWKTGSTPDYPEWMAQFQEGKHYIIASDGSIDLLGGPNVTAADLDPGDWLIYDNGYLTWMPDVKFRSVYVPVG
ncbi:hypothetical protein [Aestuariivirga sp.]|uniref:hypothetical protein n=1 Tax=Aestuariivirga sp. TaxID=2650926 RepID=UPI0039E57246